MIRRARSAPLVAAAVAVTAACAITPPVDGSRAQGLTGAIPLDASRPIGYRIAEGDPETGFREGDEELAQWALEAWERAAEGRLTLVTGGDDSLIRVFWVAPVGGLYGEMRPFELNGQRGAAVFVLPDTRALGREIHRRAQRDPLFREVVVYLTCLHELGHALGLAHTDRFADIMYFFGHGGDIPDFFQRYRDRLGQRSDIRSTSALSDDDVASLRRLYPPL